MKLSAVIAVYNEELCLPCCLASLLPVLDEVILVDGSPEGPSTDRSKSIIESFSAQHPGKVVYISGAFRNSAGGWDSPAQWNQGLELATGDFIMRTAADIIYDYEDVVMVSEIVDSFPEKKYFYAPYLEFIGDTRHIYMQDTMRKEPALPRPLCAVSVIVARSLGLYCIDDNGKEAATTKQAINWKTDILFMPHVKRFHFGAVKPFKYQVTKIVKYIQRGEYGDKGTELLVKGQEAVYEYAITAAKGIGNTFFRMPYTGIYPKVAEPIRNMTSMDGYEEFISEREGI